MSKKLIVVIASIIVAMVLLSTGYGLWERTLLIKGSITVQRPLFTEQVIPKIRVVDAVYLDSSLEIPIEDEPESIDRSETSGFCTEESMDGLDPSGTSENERRKLTEPSGNEGKYPTDPSENEEKSAPNSSNQSSSDIDNNPVQNDEKQETGQAVHPEETNNDTGHDDQTPAGTENDSQTVSDSVYKQYP